MSRREGVFKTWNKPGTPLDTPGTPRNILGTSSRHPGVPLMGWSPLGTPLLTKISPKNLQNQKNPTPLFTPFI